MIYDLKNSIDAGNALSTVLRDAMACTDFGDFEILFNELHKALNSNSGRVELLFETDVLKRISGRLTRADFEYDGDLTKCSLTLEIVPLRGGEEKVTCNFVFDITLTEENSMSNPKTHEKIYLYEAGCRERVLVSIIFHYI